MSAWLFLSLSVFGALLTANVLLPSIAGSQGRRSGRPLSMNGTLRNAGVRNRRGFASSRLL